jgi:hypothetical protein
MNGERRTVTPLWIESAASLLEPTKSEYEGDSGTRTMEEGRQ